MKENKLIKVLKKVINKFTKKKTSWFSDKEYNKYIETPIEGLDYSECTQEDIEGAIEKMELEIHDMKWHDTLDCERIKSMERELERMHLQEKVLREMDEYYENDRR